MHMVVVKYALLNQWMIKKCALQWQMCGMVWRGCVIFESLILVECSRRGNSIGWHCCDCTCTNCTNYSVYSHIGTCITMHFYFNQCTCITMRFYFIQHIVLQPVISDVHWNELHTPQVIHSYIVRYQFYYSSVSNNGAVWIVQGENRATFK